MRLHKPFLQSRWSEVGCQLSVKTKTYKKAQLLSSSLILRHLAGARFKEYGNARIGLWCEVTSLISPALSSGVHSW
jgi:hypothetical protein